MSRLSLNRTKLIVSLVISSIFVTAAVLLVVNKQYVIDQITVWQYEPTAEINALVDRAGMDDYGKFLYLASQPSLEGTQAFNSMCDRVENITSILGCFSNYRIYIYDVADEQLDGIREVTAAHETLHAAYVRMGESEQEKVNILLDAEYSKLETNKEFSERMAFYARTEPGQRANELHSVIGTEVADISPELEEHYSKYFSDRQKVVALDAKYSSVFQKLEDRAKELADQLNALASIISDGSVQYNSSALTLNNDIISFNKRAELGQFASQAQFSQERAVLARRVEELNAFRTSINDNIASYDLLLIEYNANASESKKLYNSINSTLAPVPSV